MIVHLFFCCTNKNGFVDYLYKAVVYCVGGVGGIRTHARGKPSNDLANSILAPYIVFIVLLFHIVYNPQYILPILGYISHAFFAYCPPFCPPLALPKDSPKNAVSICKNKS